MKHTLTPEALGVMLIGLYMVCQFAYLGCRQLDVARNFAGFNEFTKPEKAVLGVEWLMVIIGLNLLGAATPYADYSIAAMAMFTIGFIVLLASTVSMAFHCNDSQQSFPLKKFAIDMAFFGGGFAICWVTFWL